MVWTWAEWWMWQATISKWEWMTKWLGLIEWLMYEYSSVSIYNRMLPCSWNENSSKIESVRNCSPSKAVSHPRRLESLASSFWEPQISLSGISATHTDSKVFLSHMLKAEDEEKDNLKRTGLGSGRQCWGDTDILCPFKLVGSSHRSACLLMGKCWHMNIFSSDCIDFIFAFGVRTQLALNTGHCFLVRWCIIQHQSWGGGGGGECQLGSYPGCQHRRGAKMSLKESEIWWQ
jgi:hypothetical protein